jgi:hypothetical protein
MAQGHTWAIFTCRQIPLDKMGILPIMDYGTIFIDTDLKGTEMISTPKHEKSKKEYTGDYDVCFLCGRPITSKNPKMLHIHGAGSLIVTTAEAEALNAAGRESEDLWGKAVGPECFKQHPELKAYVL